MEIQGTLFFIRVIGPLLIIFEIVLLVCILLAEGLFLNSPLDEVSCKNRPKLNICFK